MARPHSVYLQLASLSIFLTAVACRQGQSADLTAPPSAPELSRQPYLQLATPTSIQVLWRQRLEAQPIVRWGTDLANLTSETKGPAGIATRRIADEGSGTNGSPPLHSAPDGTRQYEASLTGLQPATRYFYAVFDGALRLTPATEEYSFRTLPAFGSDAPAWIWVAGDGGTGGTNQAAVHQAMVDFTKQHKIALDMFLHVGDMAYQSGLDSEFQGRFFEMYQDTLRKVVCWPAMGNHEGITSRGLSGTGPYYDCYRLPTAGEAGGVASGREAYYSFDFGKIHFVVLDSCQESLAKTHALTPLGDAMQEWLKADLEKSQAQWLIAYWHHPPYTKGSHNSDSEGDYESAVMREKFIPLLESAGVDMVLSGHSHIYERSMLLDGAYATPTVAENVVLDDGDGDPKGDGPYLKSAERKPHEGFVAVVTGNAGTSLSRMGTMPVMKRIILEHGSVLINIQGESLQAVMLNSSGNVSDTFALKKSGTVPARTKLAHPKSPPPMPEKTVVKAEGQNVPGSDDPKTKKSGEATPPEAFTDIIPRGDKWKYMVDGSTEGWTSPEYDDAVWSIGEAGFGYGDGDDATQIELKDNKQFRIRHLFNLTGQEDMTKFGLFVSYDDGFIAYINGLEVARSPNMVGNGAEAKIIAPHEAEGRFQFWSLDGAAKHFRAGRNVIAIRGWNDDPKSSDFTLHPQLILAK